MKTQDETGQSAAGHKMLNTAAAHDNGDPFAGASPKTRAILERQAAQLERESNATAEANATALPGALKEAFADLPKVIGGLRVRPIVHYDFVILRRLDSPLLKQLSGNKSDKTPYSDEDGYEMVYQFTRPIKEIAEWWDEYPNPEGARAAFRKLALEEIGMKLPVIEVSLLVGAVVREFVASFSTMLKYSGKGGGETVFTQPPAALATGSAGGSTTSAV